MSPLQTLRRVLGNLGTLSRRADGTEQFWLSVHRTTNDERRHWLGIAMAILTAVAVPVVVPELLAVADISYPSYVGVMLLALVLGVILGMRTEHLGGRDWIVVVVGAVLLSFAVSIVLFFVAIVGADDVYYIVVAAAALYLALVAGRWLRSFKAGT